MTNLSNSIKMAISTAFGCPHQAGGHGCESCLSKHIADVLVKEVEAKTHEPR